MLGWAGGVTGICPESGVGIFLLVLVSAPGVVELFEIVAGTSAGALACLLFQNKNAKVATTKITTNQINPLFFCIHIV